MQQKTNYNEISSTYNERYKVSGLDGVRDFLINLTTTTNSGKILEAGCGTGHWLNSLGHLGKNLFGVDYSIGMLNVAKNNLTPANLVNADANKLPFKNNFFDLIYVINAIHHFNNPEKFVRDSFHLLKNNGAICIIGIEPRESKNSWYMYKYFARTYEIDMERFPTFKSLEENMMSAGFKNISTSPVHTVSTIKKNDEILSDHFAGKLGASQLALLSDDEYLDGINKIKYDIRKAAESNTDIFFETKLFFYSITASKS